MLAGMGAWRVALVLGGLATISCGSDSSESSSDAGAAPECLATQTVCGSDCADLRYDPDHCGACGRLCNAAEVCSEGLCDLTCQPGLTECKRGCVNLANDLANCGACGRACEPGEVCSNGICAATCHRSVLLCGALCVNPLTDRSNCGACDERCAEGQVCSNGQCALSCQQGLQDCDGICENVLTSLDNCGACGRACASGEVCSSGHCALSCQDGLSTCGERCVDLSTDNAHCGECDKLCGSGTLCTDGECHVTCEEGRVECRGTCVDTSTDEWNCGECGTECLPTERCYEGNCQLLCPSGLTNCDGACVDRNTDEQNCGQCGVVCPTGWVCDGTGTCALVCAGSTPHSCDGGCVDALTNAHACGVEVCADCDALTGTGSVCEQGTCVCRASGTPSTCEGACVDLDTDVEHCGGCSSPCGQGQLCVGGVCTCPAPFEVCEGVCTDTRFDPAHCGGCASGGGTVCLAGSNQVAICVQGVCDVACADGFLDCDGIAANGCEMAGTGPCGNLVFLTSQTFPPDFGGVAAGDAACQAAADAAGIPGTYMAWLSDSTTSPSARFTHSDRPYVRLDGAVVAANWSHLTSGAIGHPIDLTETGAVVGSGGVLTGTREDGLRYQEADCGGWSSVSAPLRGAVGVVGATGSEWSLDLTTGLSLCSAIGNNHLYCFQQ